MDYYDLIDTLVSVPAYTDYSGYLTNLGKARVKYRPRGRFIIITSQPQAASQAVAGLVKTLFPNCSGLYQVNGTAAKIYTLKRLDATNYTDNDSQVRNSIANKLPDLKLYKITNGVKVAA